MSEPEQEPKEPQPPFNPWRDPCIFVHAHEDTYKAIVTIMDTLTEQGLETPDVGVLLNPFGHAMMFIIDTRGMDERIERMFLNNVPTAMKPTFRAFTPEEDNRPIPQPRRPNWLN